MRLRRIIDPQPKASQAPPAFPDSSRMTPEVRHEEPPQLVQGVVTLHPRGFGFVATDDGRSCYVPASVARAVLTGDRVEGLLRTSPNGEPSLRSLQRVQRRASHLLCELQAKDDGLQLVCDEPCFRELSLAAPAVECAAGDVVVVRVPDYDGEATTLPLAVSFVHRLGRRGAPGFDLAYTRWRYGFEQEFTEAVLAQAQTVIGRPSDPDQVVEDFTDIPFVTIDGASTRDLDDAVFAQAHHYGWEVNIAIADVSWYVRPGEVLDAWASRRCTSVYLPGATLPMLPEALSTGQCSLQEGELRRAVVLSLTLYSDGSVADARVRRAVIRSAARLTYDQVARYLAGGPERFSGAVEANLHDLAEVHRLLAQQRVQAGKLEFEDLEPTLVPDGAGGWCVRWNARNDAHKLVEELMLLANRTAAQLLVERYGAAVLRHQPAPTQAAWTQLREWAQAQSGSELLPDQPQMRALCDWLAQLPEGEQQAAAGIKVRSAMSPARYVWHAGDAPRGHFSLSFEWYTHFTSPIRRYADLLVHRLLLAPPGYQLPESEHAHWAELVSGCADRAMAARMAERRMWDGIKLEGFMRDTPAGQPALARAVRCTVQGVRVVLQQWQCSAWLPAGGLRAAGYNHTPQGWIAADGSAVREGSQLPVAWTSVLRERPAYPELQVTLPSASGQPPTAPDEISVQVQ